MKLEQVSTHTQTGYGLFSRVSHALTGQCGPTGNVAYERGAFSDAALLLMSLMPLSNGQPPYSICDSYTRLPDIGWTPPQATCLA
jgi:hypothetical protein